MVHMMKPEMLSDYQTVAKFTLGNTRYAIQVFRRGADDSKVKFADGIIQITNTSIEDESISVRLRQKAGLQTTYRTLVLSDNVTQEDKEAIFNAIGDGYQQKPGSILSDVSAVIEEKFKEGYIMAGEEIKTSLFTSTTQNIIRLVRLASNKTA